jgi:hypothetical protein
MFDKVDVVDATHPLSRDSEEVCSVQKTLSSTGIVLSSTYISVTVAGR